MTLLSIIIIKMTTTRLYQTILCSIIFTFFFASCRGKPLQSTPTSQSTATAALTPSPTAVSATPTPSQTPIPLAAKVNAEGITREEFQAELTRYQNALNSGTNLATKDGEASQTVLDDLINQVLMAQSAYAQGYGLDDSALQSRLDQLASQLGGNQNLDKWMTDNGYTPESFREALKRSLAAAWMRDQIVNAVPESTEQVHARQILLYNSTQANEAFAQLQSGQDFTKLAKLYDPVAGGDLGWFPRGYLTEKALEEAAFSLEPGQYSQIIQTPIGYHILAVIERDPTHVLEPNARLILQEQALSSWLQQRRAQSEIQTFLP
jgi:peptidyl-prolyl cis-trans isomerase C